MIDKNASREVPVRVDTPLDLGDCYRIHPFTEPDINPRTKYRPETIYIISVGSAAIMAPAKCTLYSLTPVEELTRLFNATVIGCDLASPKETPNKKSFQIFVVCQIMETMITGAELGSIMRVNIFIK